MLIKIFDSTSYNWDKTMNLNKIFLSTQLYRLDQEYQITGYMFMRDICECIGLPITMQDVLSGYVKTKNDQIEVDVKDLEDGRIELKFYCEDNIYEELKRFLKNEKH